MKNKKRDDLMLEATVRERRVQKGGRGKPTINMNGRVEARKTRSKLYTGNHVKSNQIQYMR